MKWETKTIDEISLNVYDGPHATPKESNSGGIFLGIKNITESGQIDLSEIRYISEDDMPKWTKRVTPTNPDIVFSYEATLHRYAIIPKDFYGCLGRRMALIRPNLDLIDPQFLYYYFFSENWRKEVSNYIIFGSTVDRIPLTEFPKFKVELPPLPTQKKIASILSAYDDLIENNLKRIRLLEEAAQNLYREWFVHMRFPGHESATFGEDGLPEGWERVLLKDLLLVIKRPVKIPKDQYLEYGNIPVIDQGNGLIGGYTDNEDSVITENLPMIVFGDHTRRVKYIDFPFACGADGTQLVYPNNTDLLPGYFYLTINDIDLSNYAYARHFKYLKEFEIMIPDKSILSHFNQVTGKLLKEISYLSFYNIKLKEARDILLPRLMNQTISV